MKFKYRQINKEVFKVLMYDIECLEMKKTKDNTYHYNLLIGNLKDIFGVKEE